MRGENDSVQGPYPAMGNSIQNELKKMRNQQNMLQELALRPPKTKIPYVKTPLDKFIELAEFHTQLPKETGKALWESHKLYQDALLYLKYLKDSHSNKFIPELQRLRNSRINYSKYNNESFPNFASVDHIKKVLNITDF